MEKNLLEEYPDILDISQMCKLLNISRKLAYKILKEGDIPYRRLGRNYRISKKAITDYFDENKGFQGDRHDIIEQIDIMPVDRERRLN